MGAEAPVFWSVEILQVPRDNQKVLLGPERVPEFALTLAEVSSFSVPTCLLGCR
jgi:hypothetical protein